MNGRPYPVRGTTVLMRTRSLNHSQYRIEYRIVWGTRYRRKHLKPYVRQALRKYLYAATKKYPTPYIHSFNADDDHVHLQIEIPPNLSIAAVVQRLKSGSGAVLKSEFRFIREMYIDGGIWSVGYLVSTVGPNEEMIRRHVAQQGRKDHGNTMRIGFS